MQWPRRVVHLPAVLPPGSRCLLPTQRLFAGKAPRLRIHSGSVLHRTKPPLVLFWQIQQGAHGFYDMQDLLVVEPGWLPEIAPEMYELKGRPKPSPGLA